MAKDPAFLFYPGDWLGGTMTFTRAHKGAYMDLLMAQFNQGHLTLMDVIAVLGPDYDTMWESKLKSKFLQDSEGKFYNERLDNETQKRKNYTASRRRNLSKDESHMQGHMDSHMENENRNENIIISEIETELKPDVLKLFKECYSKPGFKKAWWAWVEYRKERKQSLKGPKMMAGQIMRIMKLSKGDVDYSIDLIENAIESGWQGIFPIKDYSKAKKALRDQHGFRQG